MVDITQLWFECELLKSPMKSEFCQQDMGAGGNTECKYNVSCATVSETASSLAK